MKITVLNDLAENEADAIITSETTTSEEIQKVVDAVKQEWWDSNESFDLIECIAINLPADCTMYTRWGKEFDTIYY